MEPRRHWPWIGKSSALPPLAITVASEVTDPPEMIVAPTEAEDLQPISAFVCAIEYDGETRLITCRKYELIGDLGYVGAICHSASGYRQFRCDRINAVIDAHTGEVLGDGGYFARFEVDGRRERAPSWGLTPSRKRLLVCGLNVLAFMARCDGQWHRLENGAIERFVCALWLRKEWPGDAPIEEITAHAQRLSPDSEVFFRSLAPFANSESSLEILKRAVADLIDADGVIRAAEFEWAQALDDAINEARDLRWARSSFNWEE